MAGWLLGPADNSTVIHDQQSQKGFSWPEGTPHDQHHHSIVAAQLVY